MATAKSGTKKIGIFGGTFDPVHFGHLRPAEEIRQHLALDELYFIPAAVPPHKCYSEVTSSYHRLQMLEAAIRKNPFFFSSTYELEKGGPSYSIDTLVYFQRRYGEQLYFIIGWDAFLVIDTWKDFQDLFKLANFVVIPRFFPGQEQDERLTKEVFPVAIRRDFCYENKRVYRHKSGKILLFQPVTRLDISSSMIRRERRANRSLAYLTPEPVRRYIEINDLYLMNP